MHQKKTSGLPGGRVIYIDTHRFSPSDRSLYDPQLGLAGKPDYLVKRGNQIIPVEVKSKKPRCGPPDSHIFQLAAYCRLVEQTYKVRPKFGVLVYPEKSLAIDYTPTLEKELMSLVAEIQNNAGNKSPARSHQEPARCSGCGYRKDCDQRL